MKARALLNAPAVFWVLLCLPAVPMLNSLLTSDNPRIIHILVHPTGEFAARFLIIAMMITPLTLLLPGWRGPRWLLRRRRYLGVAAFGYAAAHTAFYLVDKGWLAAGATELAKTYIWTGWLAFLIFAPLAVTSTDGWIKALGPQRWKTVQRTVYGAAVLTLIHWASLHGWRSWAPAAIHFGPLILLEAYRLHWNLARRRRAIPAAPAE